MNNDENSIQQSLPLSWEDSDQNLEQQEAPKKLLLRRDPEEQETQQEETTAAPKPLLLKKAPEEENHQEFEQYEQELEQTPQIPEQSNYEEEQEFEQYEQELNLDEHNEEFEGPKPLLLKKAPAAETQTEEQEAEIEDIPDSEEESTESAVQADADHLDNEELAGIDEDLEVDISETPPPVEEESEVKQQLFQETGSFSLEYNGDEVDSAEEEVNTFEEEQEEPAPSEPESSEVSESHDEESVFALKADTYYEMASASENEDETEDEEDQLSEDSSIPCEVTTHESVQTLGNLLQDARLAKSLTIKDAAEATRIKSSYIIALENNELNNLPAKVYILNYIRQLSKEYNVSHTPIIEAYERQMGEGNDEEQNFIRVGSDEARKATKPGGRLNALVVGSTILAFAAILFAAYYMKWINPPTSLEDQPTVEINLSELREEAQLPTPELPVPSQ